MKLLDFFDSYMECRRCNDLNNHPLCKILCAFPIEAEYAARTGLLCTRQEWDNAVDFCSIQLTERGDRLHHQLKGDFE